MNIAVTKTTSLSSTLEIVQLVIAISTTISTIMSYYKVFYIELYLDKIRRVSCVSYQDRKPSTMIKLGSRQNIHHKFGSMIIGN